MVAFYSEVKIKVIWSWKGLHVEPHDRDAAVVLGLRTCSTKSELHQRNYWNKIGKVIISKKGAQYGLNHAYGVLCACMIYHLWSCLIAVQMLFVTFSSPRPRSGSSQFISGLTWGLTLTADKWGSERSNKRGMNRMCVRNTQWRIREVELDKTKRHCWWLLISLSGCNKNTLEKFRGRSTSSLPDS